MTKDELEFSISQYLDGTLAAAERDALDERLASDAEARAVFAEYQSLQGVLDAAPLPEIRWDQLAAQISSAIAREEMPAQSYKIAQWFSRPRMWAVAASLVIAAGVAFSVLRPANHPTNSIATVPPISIVRNDVVGTANPPTTVAPEPTTVIAIGPSPSVGKEPIVLRYADNVVRRPSKALIVSAAPPAQDSPFVPF